MSKTIDEKVVSMRFDNAQFESGVKTSLSTLDKLKQSLNLTGSAKGLESVGNAASKVQSPMTGLGTAVETVRAKFSALEVMGVTALANITNSAVNAGKRFVSALTIAPIGDGFKEYELMLNSIQTTMAGTGKTAKEVEEQLKLLDEYADKTVYSTSDMLNNLPKFTNAGVELEKATTAMIGIANATALAGGDAGKASIAFYNLGQAIGTGYLTRMDYNSINNAGIATMEWKNQMVEAAVAQGTLTKVGEDAYKAGKKTFTLQQLFIDGLQEQWATTDVMMKVFGDYGDETTEIGKKSYAAAQDIKTFTQMMESLKATAGTGWKDTWQAIFGDLDQAKKLWTGLTNFLSGIITKIADWRNKLIGGAMKMTSPFSKLSDKLDKINKTTKKVTKTTKELGDIVDRVIKGEFGNNWDNNDPTYRFKKLTEAGYNYAQVQNKVNEKLGYSKRYNEKVAESQKKVTKEQEKSIEQLLKLSDAQLEQTGFTKDEIKALRELEEQSKKTGKPIDELLKTMSEGLSGRELLIKSFTNIKDALVKPFEAIKEAWQNTFDPVTEEHLYNIIVKIEEFTSSLIMSEDAADNFKKVMEGVFAIFQLSNSIISMSLIGGLKILQAVLGLFNMDILDLAAKVADVIIKFRDWIEENTILINSYDKIAEAIKAFIDGLKKCWDTLKNLTPVKNLIERLKNTFLSFFGELEPGMKLFDKFSFDGFIKGIEKTFTKLDEWLKTLENSENLGTDIVKGILNGLGKGVTWVAEGILKVATTLFETFCEFFDIHSPSRKMEDAGENIIQGLINGLKEKASAVWEMIKGIGEKMFEIIKNIPWGKLYAVGLSVALIYLSKKMLDVIEVFSRPLTSFSDLMDSFRNVGNTLSNTIEKVGKSLNFKMKAAAIKDIAIAIGILAASVWVLAQIDPPRLWATIGAIAALAGIIAVLSLAISKMSKFGKSNFDLAKLSVMLISMGAVMLIMAGVIKLIGTLNPEQAKQGLLGLTAVMVLLTGFLFATSKIINMKGLGPKKIQTLSSILIKVSAALLLMVAVCKLAGKLTTDEMLKGAVFAAAFVVFLKALTWAVRSTGSNVDKLGRTLLKVTIAMMLMVGVCKLVAKLEPDEMLKGAAFAGAFVLFIKALTWALKAGGDKGIYKLGGTLFAISASLMLLVGVCKLAALLSPEEMLKGAIFVGAAMLLIKALVSILAIGDDKKIADVGKTLLAMSISIAILAGIAIILGFVPIEYLAKGIVAVGFLSLMVSAMVAATRGVQDCMKNLIVLTICVSLLIGAVVGLSFIDTERLYSATAAISAVMFSFAVLIASTKLAKNSKAMIKSLFAMTAVVLLLAGIVAALSHITNPDNAIQATAALSVLLLALSASLVIIGHTGRISKTVIGPMFALVGVVAALAAVLYAMSALKVDVSLNSIVALSTLMLAMSGVLFILGLIKVNAKDALMGALGLTLLAVPLLAFVGVLALMNNVQNAINNAIALSILAGALSLALIPLSLVGMLIGGSGGMALLGVAGLVLMAVPLLALVGVLALMQGIQNATENANLLIKLTTALTAVLVVLAIVGPMALTGVSALTSLMTVLLAFGAVAVCIGALMSAVPELKEFLATGIDVFVQLAEGVGRIIGAFVSGFVNSVASSLPVLGLMLSQFMNNAMFFIAGAKFVDKQVLAGVAILVGAIAALTAASFLESITAFIGLGGGIVGIGAKLSAFMWAAKPFLDEITKIDPSVLDGVKTLAEAVLILTGADFVDKLTFGETSFADFGTQMGALGSGLKDFITNIGTFTDDQLTTVKVAASAIKTLAQAASEIPNAGGLLADLVGDNTMGTFADQFPILGTGLANFLTNVGTFTDQQVKTVDCAAEAVKSLAQAANEIPNAGGYLATWFGDNTIDNFANQFPVLGTGLASFVKNVGTFTDEQIKTVDCGAKAVVTLAEAAGKIPNAGGKLAEWFGDNELGTFADQLPKVGTAIADFVKNIGTFSSEQVATINSATGAIEALVKMTNVDIGDSGDDLVDVSKSMKKFVKNMTEITKSSMSEAKTWVEDIIDILNSVNAVDSEKTTAFTQALKSLGDKGVKAFVKAFTGGEESKVKKAFETMISDAAKAVDNDTNVGKFKTAGTNLVDGFAAGITERTWKAEAKAAAMANAAEAAAREALDINSPSKVFRAIGTSVPEGFAQGIDKLGGMVKRSSVGMTDIAVKGTNNALSRIVDLINTDIDPKPTIKPVLDLSDVEAGAKSIGGMLPGKTLSINTNMVGAISASMNKRQNGNSNSEVVSAIAGLRKDISTMPRNTYTINGITYDDGSNITEAVETLVNAARVARRV